MKLIQKTLRVLCMNKSANTKRYSVLLNIQKHCDIKHNHKEFPSSSKILGPLSEKGSEIQLL